MITSIVPAYNSEKYIDKCLKSIQLQSIVDLQIIVIDDGSPDKVATKIDEAAFEDERLIIVHETNKGVSFARNAGLQFATGDWISFIDSDDALESDMYELLLSTALSYGADIVHCGYKRMNEDGTVEKEISGTHKIIKQSGIEAIPCFLEGRYFVGSLWNKLISRKLTKDVFFENGLRNNEDVLFAFEVFKRANSAVFIDETKYLFFDHPLSATSTIKEYEQMDAVVMATDKMIEKCSDNLVMQTLKTRRFTHQMAKYRICIFDGRRERELKKWLKGEYKQLNHLNLSTKIQYYLMMYSRYFYKVIYSIYNYIRKVNWDVIEK